MEPKKGYWQRQAYMLSSIGLFYLILIALFAIPLMAVFVVILIQGVMDFRYLIMGAGFMGFLALIFVMIKVAKKLWNRMRKEGAAAGDEVRQHIMIGKPFEISIFNGLVKFKYGQSQSEGLLEYPQNNIALLPHRTDQDMVSDAVDQLQYLSALKQSGAIDENEFNMLKAKIMDATATPDHIAENQPSSGSRKT